MRRGSRRIVTSPALAWVLVAMLLVPGAPMACDSMSAAADIQLASAHCDPAVEATPHNDRTESDAPVDGHCSDCADGCLRAGNAAVTAAPLARADIADHAAPTPEDTTQLPPGFTHPPIRPPSIS